MNIDADYLTLTLADLVKINSINPAFSGAATNEREIADYVTAALERLGMTVSRHEPESGRASVVRRLTGKRGGRALMLYAHLDTVGIERMADPFSGEVRDGRLYGRGA